MGWDLQQLNKLLALRETWSLVRKFYLNLKKFYSNFLKLKENLFKLIYEQQGCETVFFLRFRVSFLFRFRFTENTGALGSSVTSKS